MSVEAMSQMRPFECSTDASFDRRTLRHPDVNRLELREVDHACATAASVMDINADVCGDGTDEFVLYSGAGDRALIDGVFRRLLDSSTVGQIRSEEIFIALAHHPETVSCLENHR